MSKPFIIYSLPRSRTVWLSKLLTYDDWECMHDPLDHFQGDLAAIANWLRQPKRGIIDTGLVQHWRQMKQLVPEAQVMTVRRDELEVWDSMRRIGQEFPIAFLYQHLQDIEKEQGVRRIEFGDINDPAVCNWLLSTFTGSPDFDWCVGLKKANIQLNIEKLRSENRVL